MRQIPISSATLTFWEDLVFLEAALLASPDTAPLAEPVSAHLNEGEALMQEELTQLRGTLQARARGVVADIGLDDAIQTSRNDVLHHVQQDRKAKAFTSLFKQSLSQLIRFSLPRQVTVVRDILKSLSLPLLPDDLTARLKQRLSDRLNVASAVLTEIEDSVMGTARLRLQLTDWKADANAVRTAVYGDLLKLAAANKRPRSWAERFFFAASSSTSSSAATQDPPSDPSPDEQTA
jgi:hypothetical protein